MDLVRDLLDKLVVDRNGRELGRVDRIVLETRDDSTLRVAAIEIGPAVLASRVSPFLGQLAAALEHAAGIAEGRPMQIAVGDIIDVGGTVKIDRAFSETPASTVERGLRRWIARLPGAK